MSSLYVWPHRYVSVDKHAEVLDEGDRDEIGTNTKLAMWLRQLTTTTGCSPENFGHRTVQLEAVDTRRVTSIRSGHRIHRSVYRQHKDADEDRGSLKELH